MATMNIPDFSGTSTPVQLPNANGRAGAANSRPAVLATEDKAVLDALAAALGVPAAAAWASGDGTMVGLLKALATQAASTAPVPVAQADEYETVAASATDQVMGATGAIGDRLAGIIIQPQGTTPGNVIIKDGSTTIYTWPGSSSYPSGLPPLPVPLGIKALGAGFKITTGTNVTVIALGDFT